MQVNLVEDSKDAILELLARLKTVTLAEPPATKTTAVRPTDKAEAKEWKAQRAAEALAEEKAKRKRTEAKAALLADEFKAEAKVSAGAATKKKEALGTSVRLTLCSADKPSDRKLVVLSRASDLAELLKVAKAKLRLKKAQSARLLDSGVPVRGTAGLPDGSIVAISIEPPPPEEEEAAEPAAPAAAAFATNGPVASNSVASSATGGSDGPFDISGAEAAAAPAVEAEAAALAVGLAAVSSRRKDGSKAAQQQRSAPSLLPRRENGAHAAAEQKRLGAREAPAGMVEARAALPIAAHRESLLAALGENPVTVVQGEPGCGKSTQLPQFLLEEFIRCGRAADAAIIVAQPRRVSAVSLAMRVAEERGEPIGETVGYAVRGEARAGRHCRILFCTTGWLLKQLAGTLGGGESGDGERMHLRRLSHVIVDEVHERSMLTDVLLGLLRVTHAAANDEDESDGDGDGGFVGGFPRVVAMSATVNAEECASFFGGAPIVRIPGRMFPVETLHVEEVARLAGCRPAPAPRDGTAEVDFALLLATIEACCAAADEGGILVFLPGVREIERCCAALEGSQKLRDASVRVRVLPLHGSLPPAQQRRAFEVPPAGTRKVVVATNVAETSVTIADVTHVIDVGLAKANKWNPATRLSSMHNERISAASAEQRRGRAGRVRAGRCYRLWPSSMRLAAQEPPEMIRAPLEDLILDVALLGAPSPAAFLGVCPTPPKPSAVALAVEHLVELQALERVQQSRRLPPNGPLLGSPNAPAHRLTPLGVHLGRLPVDPRVGRMLLLAAITGCLHPILSVAAALTTTRSAFSAPRDKQADASAAQCAAFAATRSDQLAVAAAYDGWVAARAQGSSRAERAYCATHFLDARALREIDLGRRELLRHLVAAGFVSPIESLLSSSKPQLADGASPKDAATPKDTAALKSAAAPPLGDVALLRGIITAGLYPNVAVASRTTAKSHATYEKLSLAGGDVQAWMHPSSINSQPEKAESGLYVYLEKQETTRLFLRGTSRVPPAALLLFGAQPDDVDVERVKQSGRVDLAGGLRVRISPTATLLFKVLRRELDALLVKKARAPDSWPERSPAGKAVVETVRAVIGRY